VASTSASIPASVVRALEEWRKKLVDLTRRNRLIYFRPSKTSTLKLLEPDLDAIYHRLAVQEQAWDLLYPEDLDERDDHAEDPPALAIVTQPKQRVRPRRPNELKLEPVAAGRAEVALRNIYRRFRTDFEERGVRILYIAAGILEWEDVEKGDRVKSPVLLIPCGLERTSVLEPFRLTSVDEPAIINPALAAKLKNDFKIDLPDLQESDDDLSLSDYLTSCRRRVSARGWTVTEEAWLGLFTFHKLVMYEDLKKNAGVIGNHPMIAALAGESPDKEFFAGEFPTNEELERTRPHDQYLVVDADRSQLACVEAAQRGVSFILQGPPGTGKSQTITNLIANSIARGKTVLFVSEKMAALEVVQRRLDRAKLGPFCLELHSSKANKKLVIQELARCIDQRFSVRQAMSQADLDRLFARRNELNSYVQTLHRNRSPLSQSPYQVLGKLAENYSAPILQLQPDDEVPLGLISGLSPEAEMAVDDTVQQMLPLWDVALAEEKYPWFGCEEQLITAETRDVYKRRIEAILGALGALEELGEQVFTSLLLDRPNTLQEIDWLLSLDIVLRQNPGCLSSWLRESHEKLKTECREFQAEQLRRSLLIQELNTDRTHSIFDFADGQISTFLSVVDSSTAAFGDAGSAVVFGSVQPTKDGINSAIGRLGDILKSSNDLREVMTIEWEPRSLEDIRAIAELTLLAGEEHKPDLQWLEPGATSHLRIYLDILSSQVVEYSTTRDSILSRYRPEIFDLDLNQLAYRVGERYQSPLRFISSEYYRDCRRIRGQSKDFRLPKTWRSDVYDARATTVLRERISMEASEQGNPLGAYFDGVDTRFDWIELALHNASRFGEIESRYSISQRCRSLLGHGTHLDPKVVSCAQTLLSEIDTLVTEVSSNAAFKAYHKASVPSKDAVLALELTLLSSILGALQHPLSNLARMHETFAPVSRSADSLSWEATVRDLIRLREYKDLTRHLADESIRLANTYGRYFTNEETDWGTILSSLDYVNKLQDHLAAGPPCAAVFALVDACTGIGLGDELRGRREQFSDAFVSLSSRFTSSAPLSQLLRRGSLSDLQQHLQVLLTNIDDLRRWADYRALLVRLDGMHFAPLFRAAVRQRLARGEVSKAINRALMQRWYDYVCSQEAILERFRGDNHETLIAEFRKLDREHWQLGSARVIIEASKLRPNGHNANSAGEVGILRRQAELKRRQLPLRTLFEKAANLIPRLKPCLLMSPLSVSQFLGSTVKFDVIIFDEASQICPEDAVGAIYRGKQLIVCGDHKQLPPTAFFQSGTVDELDDEGSEEQFDLFDSILDNCRGIDMANSRLEWHYRSKHESLIAFSNAQFYESQLVTFPSATRDSDDLGVKFHFVADGVYDRGGTRTNPREATVVANLVIDHQRRFPDKSLGVVAFSQTQMEAIQNEIERRLRQDAQDLANMLDGSNLDGFFVKNIENVQGDERDVMIFSIGYGKDKNGQLTANFGPINRDGGERRLNVAVTRAKEKVVVVCSIRAGDIDVAGISRAGPLNLYHYLNYAEHGDAALQLTNPEGGEYESPLEVSIGSAIRELGYQVIPQVGVSKYRIDLGVVHPGSPGRFILGVECDGAMYHSAYLARERDRLRQYVLELQGWRIHRIWGPDWVAQRNREIEKLRTVLLASHQESASARFVSSIAADTNGPIVLEVAAERPNRAWCEPYRPMNLDSVNPPTNPADRRTADAVFQVLRVESPIHRRLIAKRLADSWGYARIGDRIQGLIDDALRAAIKIHRIALRDGEFILAVNGSETKVRIPVLIEPDTFRPVEFIHDLEIEEAAHRLLIENVGMPVDGLITEMARLFGFDRTGSNIATRFEGVIKKCLKEGCLSRSGDMLTVVKSIL
jgi:very-short-patch-repair endonuclease